MFLKVYRHARQVGRLERRPDPQCYIQSWRLEQTQPPTLVGGLSLTDFKKVTVRLGNLQRRQRTRTHMYTCTHVCIYIYIYYVPKTGYMNTPNESLSVINNPYESLSVI